MHLHVSDDLLIAIFEEFRVNIDVVFPLLRNLIFFEDGLDGALWLACTTADAFFWVDVQLHIWAIFFYERLFSTFVAHPSKLFEVYSRMDAVDGANVDTGGITNATAWIGDYINHLRLSQLVYINKAPLGPRRGTTYARPPHWGQLMYGDNSPLEHVSVLGHGRSRVGANFAVLCRILVALSPPQR